MFFQPPVIQLDLYIYDRLIPGNFRCLDSHAVCRNIDFICHIHLYISVKSASAVPPGIFFLFIVNDYLQMIVSSIVQRVV